MLSEEIHSEKATDDYFRILIALLIAGYAVYDNVFPRAEDIIYPAAENILSVSLSRNDGTDISADTEALMEGISNACPTRRMSVNDYPSAESYYIFDISSSDRQYRYYIYRYNKEIYIEMPYEGIYKADREAFDFIEG